jgi:hypothetical protein
MSWKTVNRILGQAGIDPAFRQRLQDDPLAALEDEGIQLTSEEQEAFLKFHALPFPQFCQRLLEALAPEEQD